MGCALQFGRYPRALGGIGEVDRDVAGAVQFTRPAAGQRDDLGSAGRAKMPQSGVSHESRRAGDNNLFARHLSIPMRLRGSH
jgi:hypothetical protein